MNEYINNKCSTCNERFSLSIKEVCVCLPCEHLCHNTNECRLAICKICNSYVAKRLTKNQLNKNDQRYIDIMSVYKPDIKYSFLDYLRGIYRVIILIPYVLGFLIRIIFNKVSLSYLIDLNKKILSTLNINIDIINKNKLLDNKEKRIIIANHTNIHDAFVIGSIAPLPFVANSYITEFLLGRNIMKNIPHVILNQKEKGYEQIKQFIDKKENNKLLIFPEGFLSGTNTLARYRSTAFNLGYPVQPVIIKYKQDVARIRGFGFLMQEKINVKVIILDSINTNDKELIRQKMANIGGFMLSRVENK